MDCPTCGGPVVQKNRLVLFIVGAILLLPIALARRIGTPYWLTFICALIGAYFLAWATIAAGRWCRNCKRMTRGR